MKRCANGYGFTCIDATEEIHIQQAKVRQLIRERIDLPAYRRRATP